MADQPRVLEGNRKFVWFTPTKRHASEYEMFIEVVARRLPSLEGYDAYLAGPPPMIDAAIPLLRSRGVRARNIHFDAFLPTGGP